MTAMSTRPGRPASPRRLALGRRLALVAVVFPAMAAACVPPPVGRATPAPSPSPSVAPPTPSPAPTGPTPSPSFVRPTPLPSPTFLVYVVRSGDTLTSIARQFDTSAFSLAAWNRGAYPSLDPDSPTYEPDRIQPGWTLQLIPGREIDEEELLEPPSSPAPSAS
jgi:hypothetical protein